MPIASLDAKFLSIISNLQLHASSVASASLNVTLRSWCLPAGITDPLLISTMKAAFSREAVGVQYGNVLNSPNGSTGDAASLTLQSDYIAAFERSFRLRHASPIRCRMHAAARRTGHGVAANGVFSRVASYAQDLILAGAVGFAVEAADLAEAEEARLNGR